VTTTTIRLPSPLRLQQLCGNPYSITSDEVQAMAGWIHQQLEARARSTDPDTSHEAARSIGEMTGKRQAVLDVLRHIGPATDAGIIEAYRAMSCPEQSESGIRSRRHELHLLGLIRQVGDVENGRGRRCIVWGVA
jgi:hypothetical protein